MPKLDEKVGEVGPFTIFRKVDSKEYEIVGPAVENSPLAYTVIRTTPNVLDRIRHVVKSDALRQK